MTDAQIDATLNAPYPYPPERHTVADVLTMIFDQDWEMRRKVLSMFSGDIVNIDLRLHLTIPMEVARAHLTQLMKLEAKNNGNS